MQTSLRVLRKDEEEHQIKAAVSRQSNLHDVVGNLDQIQVRITEIDRQYQMVDGIYFHECLRLSYGLRQLGWV